MKGPRWKLILFSLSFMLGIYLLLPAFQVLAQDTRAAQTEQTTEYRSAAEVDSNLAGMSDEQVRQAYAQKLKQDAEKQSGSTPASQKGRPNKVIDSFYGGARAAGAVLKRVGSIFSGEDSSAAQGSNTIRETIGRKGGPLSFWHPGGFGCHHCPGVGSALVVLAKHLRHPEKLDQCRTIGKITIFRTAPFTHTAGCNRHRCLCSDNIYSFCIDLPGGKTEL
jgi:hypothetical protein